MGRGVAKRRGFFRAIPESNRVLTPLKTSFSRFNSATYAKWLTGRPARVPIHKSLEIAAENDEKRDGKAFKIRLSHKSTHFQCRHSPYLNFGHEF